MLHVKVITSEKSLKGGDTFPEANSGTKSCKMDERKKYSERKGEDIIIKMNGGRDSHEVFRKRHTIECF